MRKTNTNNTVSLAVRATATAAINALRKISPTTDRRSNAKMAASRLCLEMEARTKAAFAEDTAYPDQLDLQSNQAHAVLAILDADRLTNPHDERRLRQRAGNALTGYERALRAYEDGEVIMQIPRTEAALRFAAAQRITPAPGAHHGWHNPFERALKPVHAARLVASLKAANDAGKETAAA